MKYTCTFPKFPYKILTARCKTLKTGDLYNFTHPVWPHSDSWDKVTTDRPWGNMSHDGWVFIRPMSN